MNRRNVLKGIVALPFLSLISGEEKACFGKAVSLYWNDDKKIWYTSIDEKTRSAMIRKGRGFGKH